MLGGGRVRGGRSYSGPAALPTPRGHFFSCFLFPPSLLPSVGALSPPCLPFAAVPPGPAFSAKPTAGSSDEGIQQAPMPADCGSSIATTAVAMVQTDGPSSPDIVHAPGNAAGGFIGSGAGASIAAASTSFGAIRNSYRGARGSHATMGLPAALRASPSLPH